MLRYRNITSKHKYSLGLWLLSLPSTRPPSIFSMSQKTKTKYISILPVLQGINPQSLPLLLPKSTISSFPLPQLSANFPENRGQEPGFLRSLDFPSANTHLQRQQTLLGNMITNEKMDTCKCEARVCCRQGKESYRGLGHQGAL